MLTDTGKIADIITYEEGKIIASFKDNLSSASHKEPIYCDTSSFFYDSSKCGVGGSSSGGGSGGGYYTREKTDNYTDWYKVYSIGNTTYYEYMSTRHNYTTYRYIYVSGSYNYYGTSHDEYTSKGADQYGNTAPVSDPEKGPARTYGDGPSCKSFNFENTTAFWQEAAVRNIKFTIYLLDYQGIKYKYTISFPQPVLFGMPSNFTKGGEIGPGASAEASANALNNTMSEIAKEYANTYSSENKVERAFMDKLKYNYPLYIPGGRINFNATNYTVSPTEYKTEYKTEWLGTGNCP